MMPLYEEELYEEIEISVTTKIEIETFKIFY
jgi:hypothetical protein